MRGYLFALAGLAWLLGPHAFLAATTGMVGMLLWRQFASVTATAIRHSHAALGGVIPWKRAAEDATAPRGALPSRP